jgi:hypothetical protein
LPKKQNWSTWRSIYCEAIKELLPGGNSALKSLVLSSVQINNANVEIIADGLGRNNSVKCFSYRLGLYEKAVGFVLVGEG